MMLNVMSTIMTSLLREIFSQFLLELPDEVSSKQSQQLSIHFLSLVDFVVDVPW